MCYALILGSLIAVHVDSGRAAGAVNNDLLAMEIEMTTLNDLVGPCSGGCGACVGEPATAPRPPAPAGAHTPRGVVGRLCRAWAQRRRCRWFRLQRVCH